MPSTRIDWGHVLDIARPIVEMYETLVTLRQLFYRLVSAQVIPNKQSTYKTLSARTAAARRAGTFPDLLDRTRWIHRYRTWRSPRDVLESAHRTYRRDRTEGQDVSVYLGVEKNGMVAQLEHWFGDLGIPILALSGYSSQTYVDEIAGDVAASGRPAVLLYAGDHDPSGEDIDRDFVLRCPAWSKVVRVALTAEQVATYELPVNPGKVTDSRAQKFIEKHGELVQVELDALDPQDMRALYQSAIEQFWDDDAYDRALEREAEERDLLWQLVSRDSGDE